MNVSSVNSATFNGRIRETEIGVKYEKSDEGKKILTATSLLAGTVGLAITKPTVKKDKIDIIRTLAVFAITGLFSGTILDGFINKTRRKDANKLEIKGKITDDPNKGKKACSAIGLVLGSFCAITYKDKIGSKMAIALIPLFVINSLILGATYDHGVNKFRNKLKETQKG